MRPKRVNYAEGGAEPAEFEPGTVVATDHPDLPAAVATSMGFLGLKIVQLEGKRAVGVKDFLNGSPSFIGSQLTGPANT